ncbi:lamin tail domain-containing protein [Winogradskyella sp. A3E31]|uniref:lamin tail domain-containing protein n=1 Tax=Winogradskyella sp. A3E31 TaxID=3349637 RepID=UPI00398B30B0
MNKAFSLTALFFLCAFYFGFGQITEGFETGLPPNGGGYVATTTFNLSSGTWTGSANQILENNNLANVNTGFSSLQLRSQTGSQLTSPNIVTGGLGEVTFYAKSSTGSGSVQVNYRINGGAWTAATGSPFGLSNTMTQYVATINSASNNIEFQFRRTQSTVYIDDVTTTTHSDPPAPEIDIERNTNASITNGNAANTGNNTIFASTTIGNSSTAKTYYIHNEGNVNLVVSSLTSSNPSEFPLITNPAPITLLPNEIVAFEIQFSPSSSINPRSSTITIVSNDGDENPYTFGVEGTGVCSAGTLSLSPSSGPENTIVRVTGNNFGGSTTANFNGLDATSSILVMSSTELEVTVPTGADTGGLVIINDIGCSATDTFTVLNNTITSCEGTSGITPTDVFISEVTDKGSGSHSYVELFNGTGGNINLNNYELRIHNNGAISATSTIVLSGNLADNGIYVIAFGGTNANDPEGGYTADIFSGIGGINEDDNIRLYDTSGMSEVWVDLWGDTSGNAFTIASKDYTYRRKNTGITVPSTTWNVNDWTSQTPVNYMDIGLFDFSSGLPPTINSITDSYTTCEDVTLTVSASEGFSGGNGLAYQWYYFDSNDPTLPEWKPISDDATFSNSTTNVLTITNANALSDHQFYCEVREDDATCYSASDAIKFNIADVTWNGNWIWSDGITPNGTLPTAANVVTMTATYNTSTHGGSFSACSLIVNNGTLFIDNGHYVEVINNVDINNSANITVETKGSFVQRGVGSDAGYFSNNGAGDTDVIKTTAELNNSYDYTYWSSPITNATTDGALFFSNPNRRFWFNAGNFVDANADGVDDDANAWTLATGSYSMTPGQGFAATHGSFPMGFGVGYDYTFRGNYNTGDITYPVVYNTLNDLSLHWNLLGNPYPSALDADQFFTENGAEIYEAIYMWSHVRQPDGANPGNEVLNFNQNDYVTINLIGEAGNGADTNDDNMIDGDDIPERKIPSGQGFFIPSRINGNVTFTNAMRVSGNDENTQFFRFNSNSTNENSTKETLWLNLSSDIGIYSQICVAYADIATDGYDGNAIDTKRNYAGNAGMIYSMMEEDPYSNYVIQGKALSSLNEDEVIPVGFGAYINSSAVYTLYVIKTEGGFLNNNPIYIKDSYLNVIHDLSESSYQFTSEGGTFNDRFSIVFKNENTLSEDELALKENGLSIVELQNGNVQFALKNSSLTISKVNIIDLQGRLVYTLSGDSSREVYGLNNLSTAAYIAKVELSNGLVITKKAIKKL